MSQFVSKHNLYNSFIGFLIIAPQVSVNFIFKIDCYIILFGLLFLMFLRDILKKRDLILDSYQTWMLTFVIGIPIVIISQFLINDGKTISGHLTFEEGRDIGTFGLLKLDKKPLFSKFNLKIITTIFLGLLIGYWFNQKRLHEIKKILIQILRLLVIFQLLLIIFYKVELLELFIRNFMSDNIINGQIHGGFISYRFGWLRLSGGFSEPSFLAVVYWIILSGIFIVKSKEKHILSSKDKLLIFFSFIFLMTSTLSIFVLVSIILVLGILFNLRKSLIEITLLIIIISAHFISFILNSEIFSGGLESVIMRLFNTSEFSQLDVKNLLLGTQLGYVYTNPPLLNLIMQFGLIFILIIFFITNKYLKLSAFVTLSSLIVMLVAPNLGYPYFYISLGTGLALDNIKQDKHEYCSTY